MIGIAPIFTPSFWFATRLPLQERSVEILFAGFLLLYIVGIVFKYHLRPKKERRMAVLSWKRVVRLCTTMAILGLILLFLSYEEVVWFEWRFWYLFWGVGFLAWLGSIAWFHFRVAPRLLSEREREAERLKYFPKKA